MNTVEPIRYRYAASIKLSNLVKTSVNLFFPTVEDIIVQSKLFDKFDDAVASANLFSAELIKTLNDNVTKEHYTTISELNPKLTNKETLSNDWGIDEVAKIWIIDKNAPKITPGPIRAMGLVQLVEVYGTLVLLN
jgi:hypothetical protein